MYHFIINPKSCSGKGIRYWWIVKAKLDELKVTYNAAFTQHMGHATEIAEEICNKYEGIKNIVVLGGDGTVNEVLNGISDFKDVLLGYIPSGSSNDLARSLKIPKDPLLALANILKPTNFRYLDLGIMNFPDNDIKPRVFACSSGIGYDANVCHEVQITPLKKKFNHFKAGKFIYFAIAIKQVLVVKPSDGTVIIDGMKKISYSNVLMVSPMIHKYEGGGIKMAPAANPTDGKLSICLVHGISRLKMICLLPTILIGKHIRFKGIETFNCSTIEITLKDITSVHTDGEIPAVCSHIEVNCLPKQIRMIL